MRTNRPQRLKRGGGGAARSRELPSPVAAGHGDRRDRAAAIVIRVLLCVTPLILLPEVKDSFRLPQGLAAAWLGLASIAIGAWRLRRGGTWEPAAIWRAPAARATVPLAVVVAAGGITTGHPAHFDAAAADFFIGAACVVAWALWFSRDDLRRLLAWTIPPAVVVAGLGLDQYFGLFGTLDWMAVEALTDRLRITSTLGNPGDLAAFVVLPALVALDALATARPVRRRLLIAALSVLAAAIAVTATLAAMVAAAAGGLAWIATHRLLPARPSRLVVASAGGVVLAALVVVGASPLRARLLEKAADVARGDVNALLTGRLDGWRAALAMLQARPLAGVGQGGFRAEYAETRLALEATGVRFLPQQHQVMMATPHNEPLSVAAEQGLPGLAALAWSMWCLVGAARRRQADDRPLVMAGLVALGTLSIVWFPLHAPAVAWPWLLFLAWVLRVEAEAPTAPAVDRRRDWLPAAVTAAAVAALAWQTARTVDRVRASRLLARVESRTAAAIQARRAPSTLFAEHLAWLDTASRLDPLEIGIPIARGSQFLLLRRPDEALAAYRDAAALEPRPEIDINIGRALWMRGDRDGARRAFARAVQLNPILRRDVPPEALAEP